MLLNRPGGATQRQPQPHTAHAHSRGVPPAAVPPLPRATAGLPAAQPAPCRSPSLIQQLPCICHAATDSDAADAAAAAASAAERRLLREQRRAARQQELGHSQAAEPESQQQQVQQQEQQVELQQQVAAESPDPPPAAAPAAAAAARRPSSSRLAARRQQRARLRGSGAAAAGAGSRKRVPDALVPDDLDDFDSEDEEEGDSDSDSDAELDDDSYGSSSSSSSSGRWAAAEGQDGEDGPTTQLPQSVMQQAAAGPRRPNPRQQQQQQQDGKQQQQRGGAKGGAAAAEPVSLPEASPMYLPVLTDEDLEADPPGHKSGYVAVIGRPNAGKSTLINAIVGQKLSIVTYKPQTTRHRVVGIASDTHYQMILFDTPGIMQEQRSKLDERMMAAVVSSIKAAEVIIAVVDSGDDPQEALAMFQPGPDWSGPPMAVLLNKTDLLTGEQVEELRDWYKENCRAEQVFVGSALEGDDAGVQAIKAWAVDKLPEGPTLYPKSMVSEQPERFFVSEIIREQIFVQYGQEIPYACQVQIADFKEKRGAKDYIQAVILVERETQAPIVLGRGGAAIKKLGSAARQQIEDFLGRSVYLELTVQVAPAWRQQADKLKEYGYYDALYVS